MVAINKVVSLSEHLSAPGIETETPVAAFISGNSSTIAWPMFETSDKKIKCGVWESDDYCKKKIQAASMEYCFLLEGKVTLTDNHGQSQSFVAGEGFVVCPGFDGIWESVGKVRKHYVICECPVE